MNTTIITRFHYPESKKGSKEYKWRFNYYKDKILPKVKNQTDKDFDINVWCNDWQRESLEELGISTFQVNTKTRTNKLGYFIDFADWSEVEGLKKYDIQIGLDSDDYITPEFIKKVKDIASNQIRSTFISFQPEKVDIKTGNKYPMKRTYNHQGSPVFAIYQPHGDYKFAYETSHLLMPKEFKNFYFVDKGYCYVSVHDYNDSTSI